MRNLGILGWIAMVLVIIGGLDAGLYGLFQFHLLEVFFSSKFIGRVIYILIGLGAVYLIYHLFSHKKT